MANYEVEVCRVSTRCNTVMVEADSVAEAQKKAMVGAGDLLYGNECDAEYHIQGVRKVDAT